MKTLFTLLCSICVSLSVFAQNVNEPLVLSLWPNGAPTQSGLSGEEKELFPTFITNVTDAVLMVYKPAKPNGTCVICAPGGGYFGVSMVNEGTSYSTWMNKLGITFVVLKYRMPNSHHEIPLNDGEQAIRLLRQHAAEWGINPSKVGIMGHSAGGHFAATLSTLYTSKETRPDFSILMYPVISMEKEITHMGSREALLGKNPSEELVNRFNLHMQVNENTPPAILVLASDDNTVNPLNSIGYYSALIKHGVQNCSMFIYPYGGHGFGFEDRFMFKREWTAEVESWLRTLGML